MSNEEILNYRWKTTDKTLKDYLKNFRSINTETLDKLVEVFDTLDITYSDLNKPISKDEKRKLDRKIKEWKKQGLLTGYFAYLISKKSKYTYSDLLEILVYGVYVEQEEKIKSTSQEVFTIVAKDVYSQALKEIPVKPKKKFSLTWEFIWSLLWIPTYNKSWDNYLQLLTMNNYQEAYKQILNVLQQDKGINSNMLKVLMRKQNNRVLSINDDKYSGVLSDTCRQLGNKIYIVPFKNQENLQVRFIAEMDKRTTKMCESMNNMLFYVNDWNKFYRYSDIDGRDVFYSVKGLEPGINLPPINNHFHWCRSTITYQITESRENINEVLKTNKEKNAIQKWLSSDFYTINDNMRRNIKLTKEEKEQVKNLYRFLNKTPNYNGDIIRTLELYGEDLETFIQERQVGKIFSEKTFTAYSINEGYNKNANIKMYIFNSKNSKNLLQYNKDEAEVLYQYGKKFRTVSYEKINNIHYFELEEIDD